MKILSPIIISTTSDNCRLGRPLKKQSNPPTRTGRCQTIRCYAGRSILFWVLILSSGNFCRPTMGIYWKLRVVLDDYLFSEECFPVSCSQPRLRLVLKDFSWSPEQHSAVPPSERSIGWPISKETLALGVPGVPRNQPNNGGGNPPPQPSWTSILTPDEAGNLTVHAAISGIDSTYNFPRICDFTGPAPVSIRREFSGTHPLSDGTCFNVTVRVVWSCCGYDCPAGAIYDCCDVDDPRVTEALDGQLTGAGGEPPHIAYTGPLQGYVPGWIALALGVAAVLFLVIVLLLLTAYLNRGKQVNKMMKSSGGGGGVGNPGAGIGMKGTKKQFPGNHSRIVRNDSQDSGKYDVPWDQNRFRPLPDYVRSQVGGDHSVLNGSNTIRSSQTQQHYSTPMGIPPSYGNNNNRIPPRIPTPPNGANMALYAASGELKLDGFAD